MWAAGPLGKALIIDGLRMRYIGRVVGIPVLATSMVPNGRLRGMIACRACQDAKADIGRTSGHHMPWPCMHAVLL